jgi:hypothetical protein
MRTPRLQALRTAPTSISRAAKRLSRVNSRMEARNRVARRLDDATADELARAPVRYENGRSDDWESRPAEIRYL